MACGFIVFLPLWALRLRDRPANNLKDFSEIFSFLSPVALYQSLTHAAGVIALGAGAVSFTQVVKASEPVRMLYCKKSLQAFIVYILYIITGVYSFNICYILERLSSLAGLCYSYPRYVRSRFGLCERAILLLVLPRSGYHV